MVQKSPQTSGRKGYYRSLQTGSGEYIRHKMERQHWLAENLLGEGLRIYLHRDGEQLIILFCGGDKASQENDIKRAKELLKEYQVEKGGQ